MNKIISAILVSLGSTLCAQLIYAELLDPTRPPANIHGQTVVSPTLFILNAVIISRGQKMAVINGFRKKIGDEILGEHVTAIHENTVQLEGPSGKITLFLFGKPIKESLLQGGCKREWNVCMDARKQFGHY
jgi:hypothetical protein